MTPKASTDTPSVETAIQRLEFWIRYDSGSVSAEVMREAADLLKTLSDKLQRAERERDVALGDVGWQRNQISNYRFRAEAAEAKLKAITDRIPRTELISWVPDWEDLDRE